jgi:integrase
MTNDTHIPSLLVNAETGLNQQVGIDGARTVPRSPQRREKGRRRGTVVPRGDGRWLIRITLGYDARGQRVRHNELVRGTKADAERRLTALLKRGDDGVTVQLSKQGLGEWIEEWLSSWCGRLSDRTRLEYQLTLGRYLPAALLARRIANLTATDIQELINEMTGRGLAPRTVRYLHAILRACLNRALRLGKVGRNVATLVDLPRQARREMKALSPSQAKRLLAVAEGHQHEALLAVLLTGGLRPAEALGLRWSDVDSDRLHIQRALLRPRGGGWRLAEPKTSRSRRVVVIPASTVRLVARHRAKQLEERLLAGPEYRDSGFVFATALGEPLDMHNITARAFKPLLRLAELPEIRLYDLRHSAATLRLANGENPKVVSEMLGHASVVLTLDTYSHVLPEMQAASAARLESLLFPAAALARS